MIRGVAIALSICAGACASATIDSDGHAAATVVQGADLTCAWLLRGGAPPEKAEMERLNWMQVMARDKVVIPDFMQRFVERPPALAGYRLRFGDAGDIIASYWEDHCYGILSSDLLTEGDPARMARATQSLHALDVWISKTMPDSAPIELSFKSGKARPFVARADPRFTFYATVGERGSVEWQIVPTRGPVQSNHETPAQ
jgi:hypothetical protein